MSELDPKILARAQEWAGSDYDDQTRQEIQALIDAGDSEELTNRFYKDLEFGTGGLRGIMGAGSNRMNVYTVRSATQGFANYIKKAATKGMWSVVIGYDCRNNSKTFALEAARVMAGNSIRAYVYEGVRPTPMVAYAVRHYRATGGIILTASHNPKEYNGYKAYWSDGAQVTPPHDKGIIQEVAKVLEGGEIKRLGHRAAVEMGFLVEIGADVDEAYFREVLEQQRFEEETRDLRKDLSVVYTPLHGVGGVAIPKALKQWGFSKVSSVACQIEPDGDFPTVPAPNPEDPKSLQQAIDQAKETEADLVMATDADSDRLGVGVRVDGDYVLLNGNQIACLMLDHVLRGHRDKDCMPEKPLAVSTIVTSPLMGEISRGYGVEFRETLTGFKWISAIIRECEEKKTGHKYLFGAEESFGYMAADYVRDKDAVSAACLMSEAAALAKAKGQTLLDRLDELYHEYGYYEEGLQNFFFEGKAGQEKIGKIMAKLRENPPQTIAGRAVERIDDVQRSITTRGGEEVPLVLPQSNVLIYHMQGGWRLAARPSGTEPKIKFYTSIRHEVGEGGLAQARAEAKKSMAEVQADVEAWVK